MKGIAVLGVELDGIRAIRVRFLKLIALVMCAAAIDKGAGTLGGWDRIALA